MNPVAGPPSKRLSIDIVTELFANRGIDAEILVTHLPGGASELAAGAAEKHPIVIAVGGDGTVSEVVNGIVNTDAKFGLLPCGSGNDFAAGLGVNSVKDGVDAVIAGKTIAVDVAEFAGKRFINSCGLFLDGDTSLVAASVPRQFGKLRYLIASALSIMKCRPIEAKWQFDAEEITGQWMLVEVGNGPYCGGGFKLTPAADMTDGLLDFCMVSKMPRWSLAKLLPKGIDGSHLDRPEVLYPRSCGALVTVQKQFAVHWDGEAKKLPAGDYRFDITQGALQVLAPGRKGDL
jgi:diacylglycerol kinase (ATP)